MIGQDLFEAAQQEPQKTSGPVTCLGMTFENPDCRRGRQNTKQNTGRRPQAAHVVRPGGNTDGKRLNETPCWYNQ